MTEELSQKDHDEIRRKTRKLIAEKFAELNTKPLSLNNKEELKVNQDKWEGLLDFVELDLYDFLTQSAMPHELDYDRQDPKQDAEYRQAVKACEQGRKEMTVYFHAFSEGRRMGKFDNPNKFIQLFSAFKKFQERAINYFLE